MNTKNIKAVIFDMDGTLIDTEKYYRMFWPKALAHFGYEMTDEQLLARFREGLDDARNGHVRSASEAFADFRRDRRG